jgi:hypothetical protein
MVSERALEADVIQQFGDLRAAAVHDHDVHAVVTQLDHVVGQVDQDR